MMIQGRDYIGLGVGAMVFNTDGKVFLAQRGPKATNEQGTWEFPGGKVAFGEPIAAAVLREFHEEYEMEIEIRELLGVSDHILVNAGEHWVSPIFIARYISGTPSIREPEKCVAIGWFALDALPQPLSQVSSDDIRMYREKYGEKRTW